MSEWRGGEGEVCELHALRKAHLPHVCGIDPEITNGGIGDVFAVIEVDFKEKGTFLGKRSDRIVRELFDAAKLDPAEEGAMFGESLDADGSNFLASEKVDPLKLAAILSQGNDCIICDLGDSRQINGDEVGEGRDGACQRVICQGGTIDKSKALKACALRQATKDVVGEVRPDGNKVKAADKGCVGECLVVAC